PGIFEERRELLVPVVATPQLHAVLVSAKYQVLRSSQIEGLRDLVDRARKIGQQVSRRRLIIAAEAGYDAVIDALYRHAAWAERSQRKEIAVVAGIGSACAHFATYLECVSSFSETDRVPITLERTRLLAGGSVRRGPKHKVVREQRGYHTERDTVGLGKQCIRRFPLLAG